MKPRTTFIRTFIGAAATGHLFLTATISAQTTRTWDGGGVAGTAMNTAANWSGNTVPVNNDTALWDGTVPGNLALTFNSGLGSTTGFLMNLAGTQTGNLTITNNAGTSQNIRLANSASVFNMDSGAGAFTMGGSGTVIQIVLGSLGGSAFAFTNNSANDAVFGSNVTWATGGGAAATVTFGGTGNFSVAGQMFTNLGANVGAITKNGAGTLTLSSGSNAFTGGVMVNGGTLAVGHNSALGSGTINMNNSTTARIRSTDATARTLANAVTISQSAIFGSAGTGNLTFTGTVNSGSGAKTWTVDGITAEFSNAISGSNTQTKAGEGTLLWSGDNSATLTGAVQINAGALRISHATALGNTTGATNIAGGSSTAVLELTNNISVAENIVVGSKTSAANTTLRNVSGSNTLTGAITLFGGGTEFNIESEAGLLTINSNLQTQPTAARFLNVSGAGSVALLGNIQDNGAGTIGLTKSGAGTLALSGTNTYTGDTTLNGGLLTSVNNVVVASSSTLNFNGGAISVNSGAGYIQSNGGTVDVNGQTIAAGSYEASLLATSGSKLTNSSATAAVIDGTGNKNTVWINASGVTIETVGDLDIQSIVTHGSSNNGFTKTGAGTLTLSNLGNDLGTGAVSVSAGTLYLSGNLGAGSVSVGSAGTIGGDGTLVGNLSFLAGADFLFEPTTTLTVNDGASTSTVSFGGFGIVDLADLTNAVANNTYTLIDGTATFDFTNVNNFGLVNAYSLGLGKSAYFQTDINNSSLNLVVIPEPRAALLGGLGLLALLRRRR